MKMNKTKVEFTRKNGSKGIIYLDNSITYADEKGVHHRGQPKIISKIRRKINEKKTFLRT